MLADLRAGFSLVRHSFWLWLTILLFALTNVTLAGPYSVALPFLVKDNLGGDVNTLGLLYAIFPVGYVLGSILMGDTKPLAAAQLAHLWRDGGCRPDARLLRAAGALRRLGRGRTDQRRSAGDEQPGLDERAARPGLIVSRDLLSRVTSIDLLGSCLLPVGYGLTGWATGQWGAATVFLLGGGLTVLVATLGLLHPQVRGVD